VPGVLITGMSGTGKSSVVEELRSRGYQGVDLDHPEWSVHAPDGDWIWNEARVSRLLDQHTGQLLFVSGCAANQGRFYRYVSHIILLSAPMDVIKERLRTRTSNPYGKTAEELALVLHHVKTVEPLIRRGATHEVDTRVPLGAVVNQILGIVQVHQRD
jgi:broad-specificity NMP kinase